MSYSLAPPATDDDSELTFLHFASSISSIDLECPPSPMQRTTGNHLEPEPSTGDIPEIAFVSSSSSDPLANPAPLLSTFPFFPASSNFPPVTLSPSLVLGDLELKSTLASLVDPNAVLLNFPERPLLSSSNVVSPLPLPRWKSSIFGTPVGSNLIYSNLYMPLASVFTFLVGFKPLKGQIRIAKTEDMPLRLKDQFPRFTDLTIQVAQQRLASSPNLGIKQIVQGLGDFWSGCAQLRAHFTFLSIKYPVIVEPQPLRLNLNYIHMSRLTCEGGSNTARKFTIKRRKKR
ncbi:hypothetical protein EDB86DRAFT_2990236 [Lactarius hatsudake]|nr:hypothetical protein EDB86DRAFT_2990236 [Lactarius hatsudake]